jgi:hypothetical protein
MGECAERWSGVDMKNSFRDIKAQVVQMGDTITNNRPLILDLGNVRKELRDAVAQHAIEVEPAAALEQALDDAEHELAKPAPRQSRLREIVNGMAALASGITASTGLIESVGHLTGTVAGSQ